MPKYKLIKDLPFQKADDTEWEGLVYPENFLFFEVSFKGLLDKKKISWSKEWGDPLTSGWFEEVKPKRWRAERGEDFFSIFTDGIIVHSSDMYGHDDQMLFNYGNYFRTQEQAEEAAKRLKETLYKYQNEIT